jgi:sugar O-acyltransferase (sialic acid O-acetyltransferase NeuD family)
MPNRKAALVGSSGHARVILDILKCQGKYQVVGFIDSYKPVGTEQMGLPVLGTEMDLPTMEVDAVFVAIGDNAVRARLTERIRTVCPGIEFLVAIHPAAVVASDAIVGAGTAIMAGAVVNPGCEIGEGCIVNTRASLDHDGRMADFSSLAPGVVTGGNVHVGRGAAIGIGASIFHGVSVGEDAVVGGGSVVTRDVAALSVAYGVPAKAVRTRQPGEKYL